ncbi:MAG: hypothetical protein HY472_00940 [Candidatus Sungbacteria bacterium]|nr:hypothetical protein [Candidatus Sungbacteria bacterium]
MTHDLIVLVQALFFIYASFLAGDAALRVARIRFMHGISRSAYAIALGYVIFGIVGLVLGLAGFFNAFYFRFFILLIFALSREAVFSHVRFLLRQEYSLAGLRDFVHRWYGEQTFLKVLFTLWILINLSLVFVPITGRDTLTFHLPVMTDIVQQGRLTFSPQIDTFYEWSPLLGEVLYASTIAAFGNHADPFVFQVVQFSTMVLLLALAYDFFRRQYERTIFLSFLPILSLSIFEVQREVMHGGYVDTPLLLFGIAALFLVLELWDAAIPWDTMRVYLASVFMAAGLGVKYNAFYFLAIIGLFVLGALRYRKKSIREAARIIACSLLIVLALAGFWYGKNLIVFGNPIYPMLGIDGSAVIGDTIAYERTPTNLLLFPYLHFGSVSERDSSTKLIVFWHFAAIFGLLGFLFLFVRKRLGALPVLLFLFIELYLGMVFFTSHHTRYFIAPLFLLPPLLLLLADDFYGYMKALLPLRAWDALWGVSRGLVYAAAVVLFVGSIHYFYVKMLYKTGFLDREQYIVEIGGQ